MLLQFTNMKAELSLVKKNPTFNDEQYNKNKNLGRLWEEYEKHWAFYNLAHENLVPLGHSWGDHDLSTRLQHFMRRKKQRLCNGLVNIFK